VDLDGILYKDEVGVEEAENKSKNVINMVHKSLWPTVSSLVPYVICCLSSFSASLTGKKRARPVS
jgi:hypothetical protein